MFRTGDITRSVGMRFAYSGSDLLVETVDGLVRLTNPNRLSRDRLAQEVFLGYHGEAEGRPQGVARSVRRGRDHGARPVAHSR